MPYDDTKYLQSLKRNFTEQLLELIKKEAQALADVAFEPWILELDGKKRRRHFPAKRRCRKPDKSSGEAQSV